MKRKEATDETFFERAGRWGAEIGARIASFLLFLALIGAVVVLLASFGLLVLAGISSLLWGW
jgi:hypothetical protein